MASSSEPNKTPGDIITFYSYKGGSGRTMALSNVACILKDQTLKHMGVLMVDWDLEAPGLHKFFRIESESPSKDTDIQDLCDESDPRPGLINLFIKLNEAILNSSLVDPYEKARYALDRVKLDEFIIPTGHRNIFMIKAGRFDKEYSKNVNSFSWENLHKESPLLIRLLADKLAESFDYVLIDSRTGYTDISGIPVLMPKKLVVVFTPNRQSYTGIRELIRRATTYRSHSDDLRPLLVYPVPSRIEGQRPDLRKIWRYGDNSQNLIGYQTLFENIFKEVYDLDECDLNKYFDEVQIQQSQNYAYGEEIAVVTEETQDRFSLTGSYQILAKWLVNSFAPWEEESEHVLESLQIAADYINTGNLLMNVRSFGDALDRYTKALEIHEKESTDRAMISVDYKNVGNALSMMGRFEQALEYHYKALEIDTELNDKVRLAGDYKNIGLVYYDMGRFEQALEYHYKALEIHTELNDRAGLAKDYMNIGDVFQNLSNYKEALEYYYKGLKVIEAINDKTMMGEVYSNIGNVLQNMDKPDEARYYNTKAVEIDKKQSSDKVGMGVFISYARQDSEAAMRLYKDLKDAALVPWLDRESILPGQNWNLEIRKAIKNSRYFIALFSSTSVQKRGYVQKEFKFALDILDEFSGEIFAIPARLDNCQIPYEKFMGIEHVDLFPDWNEGVQRLLRTFNIQ